MRTQKIGLLTVVAAAAGFGLFSMPAFADGDSAAFCQAIGLAPAVRSDCEREMTAAATDEARDSVAAGWVARSLVAQQGANFFKPPANKNLLNGRPSTPYISVPASVSNTVAAQIHRALKANNIE